MTIYFLSVFFYIYLCFNWQVESDILITVYSLLTVYCDYACTFVVCVYVLTCGIYSYVFTVHYYVKQTNVHSADA